MNTNFTKNPIVGTPLTPSVIKQIHTAVRRYMPIAGNGIRTSVSAGGTIISAIPAPAPKNQKDKPLPFEVRYDGTLDSGAGGWKIYLPTEHLVQFDGAYLDPLNDVTPILDSNGDETGWYSFDEITLHDDHVWLVISESSGAYTASFGNAEDQQAVANICIADVSYEADTQSTPETITIKQSVVGALVFGGGLEFAPAPFDIGDTKRDAQPGEEGDEDGKVVVSGIVNCKFFWDGVEKTLPDYPAPSGTATVYLNCVGTESQSASAVNGYTWTFEMSTSEVSTGGNIYRNYKLYDFNAGEVSMDWRDTFLALYSGTDNRAEPDGVSIDKIPDAAPGATPDGDEGKLQIKGFKAGAPADQNTVTDYLQGVVNIPDGGIQIVCRGVDNGARTLFYLPLSALFSSSSISGNVSLSYLADIRWDTSTHSLQKKVNSVNMKTGAVTQGNWQTITNGNTTPISSIIGS